MPFELYKKFPWLALTAPGVSSFDIWVALTSPSDGSGWASYPLVAVEVEVGIGPAADALRKAPQDFEICVDYEAMSVTNSNSNEYFLDASVSLLEGLSSWVHAASPTVYCRPLLGGNEFGTPQTPTLDGTHVLAAWVKPLPTLANTVNFGNWNVSQWVYAGCTAARVEYVTSPETLHLRVLSPHPGYAYGGSLVPPKLEYGGPPNYVLCMQWDVAAESHCRVLDGDLMSMPSSPHPEDTPEGMHTFSAWITEPAAPQTAVTTSALAGTARLRVDVPYSTYQCRPRSRNQSSEASLAIPRSKVMTDARVKALWQRIGLGVIRPDSVPGMPGEATDSASAVAAAARAVSMQHSLDVEARVANLGLPRRGLDALHNLLQGNFDFSRVMAACDFAEWTAKHLVVPRRPLRILATDPTDIEMELLDLSGMPKPNLTMFAAKVSNINGNTRACASTDSTEVGSAISVAKAAQSVTAFSFDSSRSAGDLHCLLPSDEGCAAPPRLPGEPFDLAIMSQTLEHLYDPVRTSPLFNHCCVPLLNSRIICLLMASSCDVLLLTHF